MSVFAVVIILVALGMIVGNIMLLKHSAKFSMKNLKQDPLEKAKEQLEKNRVKTEKDTATSLVSDNSEASETDKKDSTATHLNKD